MTRRAHSAGEFPITPAPPSPLGIAPRSGNGPPDRPAAGTAALAALALAAALSACSGDARLQDPCAQAGGERVRVSPESPVYVPRSGGTVELRAVVVDACGRARPDAPLEWTSAMPAVAGVRDGVVAARTAGRADIVAASGAAVDTATVYVLEHAAGGDFREVGVGLVAPLREVRDLWIHGDLGLSGSSRREGPCGAPATVPPCPDAPLLVWDLSDPGRPRILEGVDLDAQVNDVKISADGSLAVAGLEKPGTGIAVLDVSRAPRVELLTVHRSGLGQIHNVWIEKIGGVHYVFATDRGLAVLDLSDPAAPVEVARFESRGGAHVSHLHDVYVRDGLAFLSYLNEGLVILDVGHGMAGGRPGAPAEVSRIHLPGGFVHNAWYWPDAGYAFVGTEDFQRPGEPPGSFGRVWVVDVAHLASPEIVATYTVGNRSPHNFWLDEEAGVLFVAHYDHGVRAVDVSGRLRGELLEQGRELAAIQTVGPEGPGSFWGPQLHRGFVYATDIPHGVRVFEFRRR